MGVAQNEKTRITQVLVFASIYLGAILVHFVSHSHMGNASQRRSCKSHDHVPLARRQRNNVRPRSAGGPFPNE